MIKRSVEADRPLRDLIATFADSHGLRLSPRTMAMAEEGDMVGLRSRDFSHRADHPRHMVIATWEIVDSQQGRSLLPIINWDTYFQALSSHDMAVQSLSPNPLNLWIAQKHESSIAGLPVQQYMETHRFPEEETRDVVKIVSLHPLGLQDPERMQAEQDMSPQLILTSRLLWLTDTMDVVRLDRIIDVARHVKRSLYHLPTILFYPFF